MINEIYVCIIFYGIQRHPDASSMGNADKALFLKTAWRRLLQLLIIGTSCVVSATAGYASVTKHRVHVEFSFPSSVNNGKQVIGYRLYNEDQIVCDAGPVEPQQIDCNMDSESGSFTFTLTAFYEDGSESAHSPPFCSLLVDPKEPIVIQGLQLLSGQNPRSRASFENIAGSDVFGLADVIHILRQAAYPAR